MVHHKHLKPLRADQYSAQPPATSVCGARSLCLFPHPQRLSSGDWHGPQQHRVPPPTLQTRPPWTPGLEGAWSPPGAFPWPRQGAPPPWSPPGTTPLALGSRGGYPPGDPLWPATRDPHPPWATPPWPAAPGGHPPGHPPGNLPRGPPACSPGTSQAALIWVLTVQCHGKLFLTACYTNLYILPPPRACVGFPTAATGWDPLHQSQERAAHTPIPKCEITPASTRAQQGKHSQEPHSRLPLLPSLNSQVPSEFVAPVP